MPQPEHHHHDALPDDVLEFLPADDDTSRRRPVRRSCFCVSTTPHRVLPIFMGEAEAASIAVALSGEVPPRPLTHDLMAALVTTLEVHVDSVEVNDVVDGAFTAELTLSGPAADIASIPAIPMRWVRLGTPLYVNESVFDQAGSVLDEQTDGDPLDEESIEQEVADFRSFLDTLDPDDFGGGVPDEGDPHHEPEPPAES